MTAGFALPFIRRRAEEAAANLPHLMAAAQRAAQAARSGEHGLRRAGGREKFWQFRPYGAGDRPQDIDWRASARGDDVLVRDRERQTAQTTLFWCADGPGMEYRSDKKLPTKREAAITLSLAMAILGSQAGDLSGFIAGGMRPGRSTSSLDDLGRILTEENKKSSLPSPALPAPASRTGVFLCGDFLDAPEAIEFALAPLAAKTENGMVVQVLDPAEIDLPFSGRVVFQDSLTRARHLAPDVDSLRAAYRERINAQIAAVENFCRRTGWHHILHRTDQAYETTLAAACRMNGMLR